MPTPIAFDPVLGHQFIKYARLVAGRGYVHNTLGNMVMRSAHPDFPHGLAYTKHAEISLEEMELENIVITDVPTSRIVWGDTHDQRRPQSQPRDPAAAARHQRHHPRARRRHHRAAGLRRAPRSSTCCRSIRPSCWASRCISCRPMSTSRPTSAGVAAFIQDTNSIVLVGHGITTHGPHHLRGLSPAEHAHRRGAPLHRGRADRRAEGNQAGLPLARARSRRCTASPSASSIRPAPTTSCTRKRPSSVRAPVGTHRPAGGWRPLLYAAMMSCLCRCAEQRRLRTRPGPGLTAPFSATRCGWSSPSC